MATRVIPVDPFVEPREAVAAAAAAIKAGGLVALPTETVYGIAVDAANEAAVARLRAVKGRDGSKPFTLHLARSGDVPRYCGPIPEAARRLMDRYWPGPLTIVVATGGAVGLGMRVPGGRVARDVIAETGGAVYLPSANRAGRVPAASVAEVLRAFDNSEIDLVLDTGPSALQQASSVVRVDGRTWALLREGPITAEMVRRVVTTTILFVCTGNSCRSPMAESLCRRMLADRLGVDENDLDAHGFRVLSAGTAALKGSKASLPAVKVMRDLGCDISNHTARPVTRDLVDESTAIYVMNDTHTAILSEWIAEAVPKIRLLHPDGICDPIGHPIDVYQECVATIRSALEVIVDSMVKGRV